MSSTVEDPYSFGIVEPPEVKHKEVPWWTSSRFGLAIIGFLGFINVYALRVNMSVAVVCMVNHTAVRDMHPSNDTSTNNNNMSGCQGLQTGISGTDDEGGEFIWDKNQQGLILGSFFWGYLATQIPGGWLATKFGGKCVFALSMLISGAATLATPIAAQSGHIWLLLVMRIIIGLGTGTAFPAMHAMWGHWAPVLERSKLTAMTYAGAQLGNVITFPSAGLLCQYGFAGGWPSIFYVLGGLSIIWALAWILLVSDTPVQHKRISEIEKRYITQGLKDTVNDESGQRVSVPWLRVMTSLPVWAIIVANTTSDWGAYTLLTGIPTYMNEVLKFDIASNGLYSALPYIGFWIGIYISGWMADCVRESGCLTTTWTRKIWEVFGQVMPAIALITLGFLECTQAILAVVILTLAVTLSAPVFSGYVVNHVDIAPPYAGVLFGISNTIAASTGFISPVVTNFLTHSQTRQEWQIVFYVTAAVYIAGAIFYLVFASGELQPWARERHGWEGEPMSSPKITELQNTRPLQANDQKTSFINSSPART
ncbi:sialin-like [Liolophura sinensis]|uniref:sialin-like n=1 Tax=Liolophura sinensis TaxID=3198878 RepID=UPI0031596D10